MHIFITGGCGFIGSHLVEFHINQGDTVHVVDDLSTGQLVNVERYLDHPNFKFDQADLLTWPHLDDAVQKANMIYHMAAIIGVFKVISEPIKVMTDNIKGCERLMESIDRTQARPQRVIVASSSSVYGKSTDRILRETDKISFASFSNMDILQNYSLSKFVDEAISIAFHRSKQIPITIVRMFNAIGPRQTGRYGMVVPRFVKQACSGEPITVFGDGNQTRSFCDVRDTIVAINLLAHSDKANGAVVNVGNDSEITINELARIVCESAKSDSKIQYVPYLEAYGQEFEPIKQRRPDLTLLHDLTNFKHQWTLKKTIDNLVSSYNLKKDVPS